MMGGSATNHLRYSGKETLNSPGFPISHLTASYRYFLTESYSTFSLPHAFSFFGLLQRAWAARRADLFYLCFPTFPIPAINPSIVFSFAAYLISSWTALFL
jgi:hypothetical protein